MAGEDAPYPAWILDFRLPDFKVLKGNALAVEHPIDIMIRLNEKFRRVRKGLVRGKPACHGVTMRADDWKALYFLIERSGNFSSGRIGRKEAVWM
jgi:hypothetical protein